MKTVGDKFPAFTLPGINEKNEFVQVNVDEGYTPHKKDWSVVYFYPKDFTFICPTEIAGMDALEVLRTLKALQAGGLTGCAWDEGEELLG